MLNTQATILGTQRYIEYAYTPEVILWAMQMIHCADYEYNEFLANKHGLSIADLNNLKNYFIRTKTTQIFLACNAAKSSELYNVGVC